MERNFKYSYGSSDWSSISGDSARAQNPNAYLDSLNYYTIASKSIEPEIDPANHIQFLAAIYHKLIFRGPRTYMQPEVEERLFQLFPDALRPVRNLEDLQTICYQTPESFVAAYKGLRALSDECDMPELSAHNPFDPDNPENERRLYQQVLDVAGARIAGFIYPQCPLDELLPEPASRSFLSQRLDFLIALPNGKGVILEPGDHGEDEDARDRERERACLKHLGFKTIRMDNSEIGTKKTAKRIQAALVEIDAADFLGQKTEVEAHLLAPFSVHRIEAALWNLLLEEGLAEKDSLHIAISTESAELAAIGVYSFFKRLEALLELYDIPQLGLQELKVEYLSAGDESASEVSYDSIEALSELQLFKVVFDAEGSRDEVYDALIDVSVHHGAIKRVDPEISAKHTLCIRNSFRHHHKPVFATEAEAFGAAEDKMEVEYLDPFVQECFRLRGLRIDQLRILKSLLTSGDTIGLLPTGGGKSLCYQLASLLKIGVTLIIDPLIALMDDQVASLKFRSRIAYARALHSGSDYVKTDGIYDLLVSNQFVFIAPERFLRENFRVALQAASNSGARVALAVIDEAHCVSMWGHDFRPAYLELAKNIRQYALSSSGPPPILALTGTASQLVLIDLSRQLGIFGGDSIIRPNTFDRPELNFRVLPAHSKMKQQRLLMAMKELSTRLKTQSIFEDQYGMVFGVTKKSVKDAFSWLFGESQFNKISSYSGKPSDLNDLSCAVYLGSCPDLSGYKNPSLRKHWNHYKQRIFEKFTNGGIKCMVANSALSVGIDHRKIRYIVNLSMVGSLESYYQQAGRAGRNGDQSYCDLIFSDDQPELADKWINGEWNGRISGDVGTLAYFHDLNFPGKEKDADYLSRLVRFVFNILKKSGAGSSRISSKDIEKISQELSSNTTIDDVGRFVGYLSILGLIESYSVEGMNASTVYEINAPLSLVDAINADKKDTTRLHTLDSLHAYYVRYKPLVKDNLQKEIKQLAESNHNGSFLVAACFHLIAFIYDRIEYQRRQNVKTMLQYCRTVSKDSKAARKLITSYFDRSKFSDQLDGLREKESSYATAAHIFRRVEDYEDAERLYWETRRLLDELPREDWSFISVFSEIYSGRDNRDDAVAKILELLRNPPQSLNYHAEDVIRLLLWVFDQTQGAHFQRKDFISHLVKEAYADESTRKGSLEMLAVIADKRDLNGLDLDILNIQMERLLNVAQQRN
jgi:ATP-dependent DNA helicase RecQ